MMCRSPATPIKTLQRGTWHHRDPGPGPISMACPLGAIRRGVGHGEELPYEREARYIGGARKGHPVVH